MGRHRAKGKRHNALKAICVTWGLALIVCGGFAAAWTTTSAIGVIVMMASGGALAFAVREGNAS